MAEKSKDNDKEAKNGKDGENQASKPALDPKYLVGLTYSDAEIREVEEDGVKKKKSIPRTQPMKLKHVLSWKDHGKEIVIVCADGKKHRVKK